MSREDRVNEFADAALRIVGREGLASLSFRSMSAESGWSLGAVQKAFATKEDLLAATLRRAQETVVSEVSAQPAQPDLHTWLCRLVLETLPLDDARRAAVIVGIAFSDQAPFNAAIAETLRAQTEATRTQLMRLFAWRRAEGELRAHLSDEAIARAMLAFAGGLASELLFAPAPLRDVEKLVRETVGALLA